MGEKRRKQASPMEPVEFSNRWRISWLRKWTAWKNGAIIKNYKYSKRWKYNTWKIATLA